MCGRIACTLQPEVFCKACCQRNGKGEYVPAEWRIIDVTRLYQPSTNMSPTMQCPVLTSKKHFVPSSSSSDVVITPMMWGLIPPWHKGTPTNHGLTTNNCRLETIESKKMYAVPLRKGRRCVVLCDGFYEWQAKKPGDQGPKQPFFIYSPQPDKIKIEEPETWEPRGEELWSTKEGWSGPKPFMMAGLFDTWINPSDKKLVYSFTVITMDSSPAVSWIHERMPAILDSPQAVSDWLDYERVKEDEALTLLKPVTNLKVHPVSALVNNVRNQDVGLSREQEIKKPGLSSSKFMAAWLTKGSSKSSADQKRGSEDFVTPIKEEPHEKKAKKGES